MNQITIDFPAGEPDHNLEQDELFVISERHISDVIAEQDHIIQIVEDPDF